MLGFRLIYEDINLRKLLAGFHFFNEFSSGEAIH
jgi:hypothetical protein